MRGCVTTLIFLISLSGMSTFMLTIAALIVMYLEHDTKSFSDFNWYTLVIVLVYLLLFLKLIVKGSRLLSNGICDFLFGNEDDEE